MKGMNRGRPFPVQRIKKISQRKLRLQSELEVEAVNEAEKRARAKVLRGTRLALSACSKGSCEQQLSVLRGLNNRWGPGLKRVFLPPSPETPIPQVWGGRLTSAFFKNIPGNLENCLGPLFEK